METTDNEYMGVTYKVKWDDTWNTIQNRVSRARNQYFEPGTISSLNCNKKLLAGDTIVLPPMRINRVTSKVSNREFLGEKYQVRVGDTVKSIFDRLVALRCDSSITMKSFLKLNNLPESILAPYMPLPPVLKLPKPKNVIRISEKGRRFIRKKENNIHWIYNDKFPLKKTARIPLTDLTGKYYTFDFKATVNRIGNATIGIGHKLHDGHAHIDKDSEFLQEQFQDGHSHWVIKPIPEEKIVPRIEEWFKEDIRDAETEVNNITIPLNQNQFDALVSLAFNRKDYFRQLKPLLEQGKFDAAIIKWRAFDNKDRRDEEIDVFFLTKV